jgi:RHS repeat-associated protein
VWNIFQKGAMKTAKILLLIPILLLVASSSLLGRVVEPWNEHSVTWATKPQVTTEKQHWVKAPTNAYSPLNEDITALVKAVLNSVEGNCGFELKMSPEQRYRSARYASTQHSDPSRWPKLTITYTELSKHFYLKDHLGNIRVTIDQEGEVVGYNDYYPFGLQMPGRSYNGGVDHDPYKYSSKELDEENGLNWYRFDPGRSYDPVIGRWLAVDPLYHKYPSHSPYNYVLNNPIYYVDPDGKRPWTSKERTTVLNALRAAEIRYMTERGADRGRALAGRQLAEGWRYFEPGIKVDIQLYENLRGSEKAAVTDILAIEGTKAALSFGIFGDPEPNILNDTDPATGSEISYIIKEDGGNNIRFIQYFPGGKGNVTFKYFGVNKRGQYYEIAHKSMSEKEYKEWEKEMLERARAEEEEEKKEMKPKI